MIQSKANGMTRAVDELGLEVYEGESVHRAAICLCGFPYI